MRGGAAAVDLTLTIGRRGVGGDAVAGWAGPSDDGCMVTEQPSPPGADITLPVGGPPAEAVLAPAPAAVRSRRRKGSAGDLVRTTLVIAAAVTMLILLVPRPTPDRVGPVDVAAAAARVAPGLPFTPAVPRGVPDRWVAEQAAIVVAQDGLATWSVTYRTPAGGWVGLREARSVSRSWQDAQGWGVDGGTRDLGGTVWTVRDDSASGLATLARVEGEITLAVTGRCSAGELDALAAGL